MSSIEWKTESIRLEDVDGLDGPLAEALECLRKLGEPLRNARLEWECDDAGNWDCYRLYLKGERLETEAEAVDRRETQARIERVREERERAQLAELKAKYEHRKEGAE